MPKTILGYYSLSAAQIDAVQMDEHTQQKLPRYPVPCFRLGRLAAHSAHRGRGLGRLLVGCVVERCLTRWKGDDQIWRIWQTAMPRSGVRYRRPYQARHTYASMMLSTGEHPMWIAKQMGHSDWTMIARRYGRWMPSADEKAGERATELFGKKMLERRCNFGYKSKEL